MDPPAMPNTPNFFDNLLSWQQSLLDQLTTEHSHRKILEMLQASTNPPIIATDGSVNPYTTRGTFAWVLADQDGTPCLQCHGPVSGTLIDSFHTEAHALLSVLVYLNLLNVHFVAPISAIRINVYTDSESNVKQIVQNRHRKRPQFPNETLSPSWDLHQAIHRELSKLPNIAIHHIKAHQDILTPNTE
jgi:ribonuclease HI